MTSTDPADTKTAGQPAGQNPPIVIGKGEPIRVQKAFTANFYRTFLAVERMGGAPAVAAMMAPYTAMSLIKRWSDYRQFVKFRNALPSDFWKGGGPREHYLKMMNDWHECLGVLMCYHLLGTPYWAKRFTYTGTFPTDLPEWGKRPVILSFLHTGPFGILRFWMRSRKTRTASWIGAMPAILDNEHYYEYLKMGDKSYGIENVPHMFRGSGGLREAMRFLKPGHIMTMAADGGEKTTFEADGYDAGGLPICAKKGGFRVAAQTNSIVVPVSVGRTGLCRYEVRFGKPVPDEFIQKGDFAAATQHVINETWPYVKEDPRELNWTTLEALAPDIPTSRVGWP